jgi:GNAT superfamily N-acetyltransferase
MAAPATATDEALRERAWDGLVAQTRLIGRHAPGARVEEGPTWLACVVSWPVESSLINCAVPVTRGRSIADAVGDIAGVYAAAGVRKWGVWVDARAAGDGRALEQAGLVLDSTPVVMGAQLAAMDLDADPPPNAQPVDLRTVGRVNDLAYGVPDDRFERAVAHLPRESVTAWGAGGDAVVVVREQDGDASVWFVATVPQARRQGLAGGLIRAALADARTRGATTTTLWASPMGAPVYERLGYRTIGRLHLWERRP